LQFLTEAPAAPAAQAGSSASALIQLTLLHPSQYSQAASADLQSSAAAQA